MPAVPSSPIPAVFDRLHDVGSQACRASTTGLLDLLAQVVDPRDPRGVRHGLATITGLAVCAVLTGVRSYAGIAEWARDADEDTLTELGVTGAVPCESTFRRTLQALDADGLDALLGAWCAERTEPGPQGRRRVAVDGKALRGSASNGQPGRHLLAAVDHGSGAVLGQVDVDGKTNEIPMFATVLDPIDITDALVTADALHTQRAHAVHLVAERGAHYLFTVKGNQPKLHDLLRALPWPDVPVAFEERCKGHGRREWRTLRMVEVDGGLGFPHAVQAIQLLRRRRARTAKRWSTQTVYAITSLAPDQTSPVEVFDAMQGHWCIENRTHWVRDVTFDEDRSQIRTGNGPQVMATLRNLAVSLLRLDGTTNIAAGLRHLARRPERPLQLINSL